MNLEEIIKSDEVNGDGIYYMNNFQIEFLKLLFLLKEINTKRFKTI